MTLLPLTTTVEPVPAVPVPSAGVPAQRPSSDAVSEADVFTAPQAAAQALSDATRSDRDAVVWLSAHIATLDRVIYPAAGQHLRSTGELRAQRSATRSLALLVRRLHAQLEGDGAVELEDVPALRRRVLAALREQSFAERELLARLRDQLTAAQWTELTRRYAERVQRGPTRPHPHTPRSGVAGRAVYRLVTWTDHILDVLDSRTVRPIPATTVTQAA